MNNEYDVVIVGGGGAGLTAGIYSSRAQLRTMLFEKNVAGGQISITDLVENFPGFPDGVTGPEISGLMEQQALKSGVEIEYDEVTKIAKEGARFVITATNKTVHAKAVILALGAQSRMLGIPTEQAFIGKGVSYCAVCDAPFFRNKVVAVIGGGDSAIQEALYLTKFAQKVYVVHRRNELRASNILQKRAFDNEKIEFVWDSTVTEIKGSPMVSEIVVKNVKTEELRTICLNGVFVFIGHDPLSQIVRGVVDCDTDGYVKTDEFFRTSVKGMYACGEIRSGATWQLVAACGEGCRAALHVEHYISNDELNAC
jgi:thioredoxin reductase (NADPH)